MLRFQDFLGAGGPDLRDFDDASAVPGAQRQGACILLRIWLFVSAARVASVQVKRGPFLLPASFSPAGAPVALALEQDDAAPISPVEARWHIAPMAFQYVYICSKG